jgi:ABC-type transport system involved in cytochrome c biogenesis permease subunit
MTRNPAELIGEAFLILIGIGFLLALVNVFNVSTVSPTIYKAIQDFRLGVSFGCAVAITAGIYGIVKPAPDDLQSGAVVGGVFLIVFSVIWAFGFYY